MPEAPSPAPARGQRYQELDALRGIAASAVMLTHLLWLFDELFPGHESLGVYFPWGGLGVQLFFMISGFVILMTSRRYSTPGSFALARVVRLYPTYWVCLAISIAIVYLSNVTVLRRPTWELAVNATMFQSFVAVRDFDGAYWSLSREMVFYIIIATLLAIYRRGIPETVIKGGSLLWAAIGTALLSLQALYGDGPVQSLLAIVVAASVAQYAPLFGLGMLLYLYRQTGHFSRVILPLWFMAVGNEFLATGATNAALVAAISAIFIGVVIKKDVPLLRQGWLLWLGAISYPLYLLHQNIGYVIIASTVDHIGPLPSRILALSVVLGLAWMVHEAVEKRFSRWLHRRLRGGRSGALPVRFPRQTPNRTIR